jgi:hypothetical protein
MFDPIQLFRDSLRHEKVYIAFVSGLLTVLVHEKHSEYFKITPHKELIHKVVVKIIDEINETTNKSRTSLNKYLAPVVYSALLAAKKDIIHKYYEMCLREQIASSNVSSNNIFCELRDEFIIHAKDKILSRLIAKMSYLKKAPNLSASLGDQIEQEFNFNGLIWQDLIANRDKWSRIICIIVGTITLGTFCNRCNPLVEHGLKGQIIYINTFIVGIFIILVMVIFYLANKYKLQHSLLDFATLCQGIEVQTYRRISKAKRQPVYNNNNHVDNTNVSATTHFDGWQQEIVVFKTKPRKPKTHPPIMSKSIPIESIDKEVDNSAEILRLLQARGFIGREKTNVRIFMKYKHMFWVLDEDEVKDLDDFSIEEMLLSLSRKSVKLRGVSGVKEIYGFNNKGKDYCYEIKKLTINKRVLGRAEYIGQIRYVIFDLPMEKHGKKPNS